MNARRLSLMHARLEEVETEPEILPPLALFLPSLGWLLCQASNNMTFHKSGVSQPISWWLLASIAGTTPLQTCLTRARKQRLTTTPPPISQHRKVIFLQARTTTFVHTAGLKVRGAQSTTCVLLANFSAGFPG